MARYAADAIFRISPETFDEIDDWIRAAKESGRNIGFGMNALTMLMAYTNQSFAMKMSAGMVDPRMKNKQAAWKIPVRRITSRYYKGWKVKRLAPSVWMLYNDTREAWFIEFGIHPTGSMRATEKGHIYTVRVRRPIRKLSLKKTLRYIDSTRAAERVWEQSFAPFNKNKRYTGRGGLFTSDQVQAVSGMRFV